MTTTRRTLNDGKCDMKKSTRSTNQEPTHEEITVLAQQIYEEEGCPCGKAEAHWLEAERRLREQKESQREGNGQKPAPIVAPTPRERLVSA
jgi:hypothetical protein